MFTAGKMPLRAMLVGAASLLAVGCAGSDADEIASAPPPTEEARLCDAQAAQSHVGEKATEQAGAAILMKTGSRTLRWGPPRAAWTMDYRQDRVNVRYDDDMLIIDITCG